MMDNEDLLSIDLPVDVIYEGEEEKVAIDNAIDEVEDAEDDINTGDSLDDGDLIDCIALGKDAEPDVEVIKFADDQEDDANLISAVDDGESDYDAAYEKEYPELHNDDPNDDGDDITENDFEAISMDESGVNSDIVDVVLEAREEINNDD